MDLGSHGSVGIAGRVTQESGAGAAWGGIFSGASNQISLMKWGRCSSRPGRKKRASMPIFPEIAIHGNFTLGYRPFHK